MRNRIGLTALAIALAFVATALAMQQPSYGALWFLSVIVWIAFFITAKAAYRG